MLSLFSKPNALFGIPLLYFYLFAMGVLLIDLMAYVKAVSNSFTILRHYPDIVIPTKVTAQALWQDSAT